MKISCTQCDCTNCFVKICNQENISSIDSSKNVIRQSAGQFIFHEGTHVHGIYLVHSGKAKVISNGINGKVQTIRFAKSGHILGHRGIGHDIYSVSAVALDNCTLCYIPGNEFNLVLRKDIHLANHMLFFYSRELRTAEVRMKNLAQMSVREKVAEALLIIAAEFGVEEKEKIKLDVSLSRNDIGEIVSLRREQVTRILAEFKIEGIIEVDGKEVVILQKEKLKELVTEYSRNNLSYMSID